MTTFFIPIITCLILIAVIVGIGYFLLPQYSKNSAIYKVTFKASGDKTDLHGTEPFIIKSNKLLLVPILFVILLHILFAGWPIVNLLSRAGFDISLFNKAAYNFFVARSLSLVVLLGFLCIVIGALNLKLKIYWNGLAINTFFYQKKIFFSDLHKIEIHYFGEYAKRTGENPGLLHHYYGIITLDHKIYKLYPLLFSRLDTMEDAFTKQNQHVDEIVQKPPRMVES